MASRTCSKISVADLFMSIYQLPLKQLVGNKIYVYQTSLVDRIRNLWIRVDFSNAIQNVVTVALASMSFKETKTSYSIKSIQVYFDLATCCKICHDEQQLAEEPLV
jgi:hypothetical protein